MRYYPYVPSPDADQGRSDTDVRHIFNLSLIGALPFGAGQQFLSNATGLTEALVGNWQVNGIVRAQRPAARALDGLESVGHSARQPAGPDLQR